MSPVAYASALGGVDIGKTNAKDAVNVTVTIK